MSQQAHYDTLSDNQLLDLARAGDSGAAKELLRRHAKMLLRYLRGMGDRDAEDHVQQVFAKAFETTTVVQSVPAYLVKAAGNQARQHWRDTTNRDRLLDLHGDVVRGHHDHHATMEDGLAMSEALERVEQRAADLPIELREVIRLRMAGLSLSEIAVALELPEAIVKRRNAKAMRALENLLGETEGPFRGEETTPAELSIDERVEQLAALYRELDRGDPEPA